MLPSTRLEEKTKINNCDEHIYLLTTNTSGYSLSDECKHIYKYY